MVSLGGWELLRLRSGSRADRLSADCLLEPRARHAAARSVARERFVGVGEDTDDHGVELAPGAAPQLAEALVVGHPEPVRARSDHRVERVADRDDPGAERDLALEESVRVAGAVPALVA